MLFCENKKKLEKSSSGDTNQSYLDFIVSLISFVTLQLGYFILGKMVVCRSKSPLRLRALYISIRTVEVINRGKFMS